MHTATMKGLVGARSNMNLLNTPMRVYKEAKRKGDTTVMERAMGYVCDFADMAEEYKTEAEKGMKEDSKEAREKAKTELEKAVQKHKEEREEAQQRIAENRNQDTDTVEISEGGKTLLKASSDPAKDDFNSGVSSEASSVIYLKTGAAGESCVKAGTGISVSV